jgi:hypothetical protein
MCKLTAATAQKTAYALYAVHGHLSIVGETADHGTMRTDFLCVNVRKLK